VTQDQLAKIAADEETARAELRLLRDFENSVEAGFQMATFQGPLCAEPVVGMAWTIENIEYKPEEEDSEHGEWSRRAKLTCSAQNVSRRRRSHLFGPRFVPGGYARLVTPYQACHVHLRYPSFK
jgi:translation elongation factor EF-G